MPATAHATRHFQKGGERRPEGNLVVTGPIDVPRNREQLGPAVVRLARFEIGLAAQVDDVRYRGKGFGVVYRRRFAVEAERGRKRWLEPGLSLLAFDRLQQCRFFTTDIGAVAVMRKEIEVETRT